MMKKTTFYKTVLTVCLMALCWSPMKAETGALRGDCNADGAVNISDVTCLIDYLLGSDLSTFDVLNADTNRDGNVTITDVTVLIDYLLSNTWPTPLVETEEFTVGDVTFTMVKVKGGTFVMGANEDDPGAQDFERPAHEVTLSDYNIGETEVSLGLWQAVMGYNPSDFNDDPNCPVEMVSWEECQTFIYRLNQMTGRKFRLPTEAEWEFAARGGISSQSNRYAGSNNIDDVAWFIGNSGDTPHPVAGRSSNELGLYDMSGNVWEWCLDGFSDYIGEPQIDPVAASSQSGVVCRGGFYGSAESECRVTQRMAVMPSLDEVGIGLRLALDTEDTPKLHFAEPVVSCELDGTVEVEIINGSGDFTIEDLENPDFASISISGKRLRINGLMVGTISVRITDNLTGNSALLPLVVYPPFLRFTVDSVDFYMIRVRSRTFSMGATPEQWPYAYPSEYPPHEVTLDAYYIAQTEVTQALWQAVMGYNMSYFTGDLQRPAECVNWEDCQEFIRQLNLKTGKNFRLPTEAEWECAARGGDCGYIYSGSDNIYRVAWFNGNSQRSTHAVRTKRPNSLGLFDMSGNVAEYCQDYWGDYVSEDPVTNPIGPSYGTGTVRRGGSWFDQSTCCRVSYRTCAYHVSCRHAFYGLRLALTPETAFQCIWSVVKCAMGESVDVEILNGNGSYSIAEGVEGVTASVNGNTLTVTGTAPGTTAVHIIDDLTGKTTVLNVIVESDANESEEFTVGDATFKMVNVTGGTFMMGARDDDPTAEDSEKPAHMTSLSDYSIGETEVTQGLWQAVMGYSPSGFNGDPNCPVKMVSWEECQDFIYQLNQMTGRKFRLPTEAEWEYAARGGRSSQGFKYAGSDNLDEVAWYNCDSPQPAGAKAPNELGLYDMSGNVWEWCLDGFTDYNDEPQTDPVVASSQSGVVCRGGYYGSAESECRVTKRMAAMPTVHDFGIGLRLALDREDIPKFRVAEPVVSCEPDETVEVEILKGSGNYTIEGLENPDCASVSISENRLIINGLNVGTFSVTIKDLMTGGTTVVVIGVRLRAIRFVVNGVAFKMVYVPGCTFSMGATPEQWPYNPSQIEYPAHEVTLSPYSIGQTEVTQELWQAVMGYNPSYFTSWRGYSQNLQRPVECVNWDDCQEFIRKLNQLTGKSFRLPTEAEWECAARAGVNGYVYAGSDTLNNVAWNYYNAYAVGFNSPDFGTHVVATKAPNQWGIYDMSGNVDEFCQDYWAAYVSEDPVTNPTGPATGTYRVVRGGYWRDDYGCRVSSRGKYAFPSGCAFCYDGLRLALDADNRFRFSLPIVSCKIDESATVAIQNGNGSYTIAGGAKGVSATINGNTLTVTGTTPGTSTVHVIDDLTGSTAVLTVIVEPGATDPMEFTVGDVTFKMVSVTGGTFLMGSYEFDSEAEDFEKPDHEVTLSDYFIGETEVTQALWQAVMGYNPSWFTSANGFGDDLNCPVENVSWEDCQMFVSMLNQMTGMNFRLPTEAEWEFAALGGMFSYNYRYAGSNTLDDVAWYSCDLPQPVGLKMCNELGLYDMSGNVWEWCQDGFFDYNADPETNPVAPMSPSGAVCRGGFYGSSESQCRVKQRISMLPTLNNGSIGLRLAI